jgi:flagellar biogenesis protein FliO
MLKKRLVLLGLLLAVSIVGQILLRPCLGESSTAVRPDSSTQPSGSWNPQSDKPVDSLQNKLTSRLFLMLGFIAVAGVGVWYFVKKMNTSWAGAKDGQLQIVETMHLGPRKTIHIIRAGKKRLLIGNSNEGIRLLADLTGNIEIPPVEAEL